MVGPRPPALLAAADAAVDAVRRLPPRGALAREMARVRRAEILGSTALAGSELDAGEIAALLDRDRAVGNHRFFDYVLVRGYADAARWIGETRTHPSGDRRLLLGLDEIRSLNARVTAGTNARGGAWRQGNPAPAGGIVAPAAWLVTREITVLLDRFGRGPGADPLAVWIARFLGRFARLLPFEAGNGRTARLAANLMLRRLDAAPVVFAPRDRARYAAALAAAETNAPAPLAALIARSLIRTCHALEAAANAESGDVEPLRALAGADYSALAKAAQRGRLRTIVRGGRYFTTAGWIAAYRAKRPSRPARPPVRPTP